MSSDSITITLDSPETMNTVTGFDFLDFSSDITVNFNDVVCGPGTFGLSGLSSTDITGKLELNGPDADVMINGQGLNDRLTRIEQQLNIMVPNPVLEAQWDQLRALGDEYRRLEVELLEKQRAWAALQQT